MKEYERAMSWRTRNHPGPLLAPALGLLLALAHPSSLHAAEDDKTSSSAPVPNEDVLGEFVVTGKVTEHIPKIGILPSLSPAFEDVIVRSVVRRDLELSGMFEVIEDKKAPPGAYGFEDKVDVGAWQSLGAEAVVKVAARNAAGGRIEVLGLAYFPSAGTKPVYETKLVVDKANARKTAHQITDDLLGALTGRPGGFSSRFAYAGRWARTSRIFTADADGHGLAPQTDEQHTAIAPSYGLKGELYYSNSKNYSPFKLTALEGTAAFKFSFSGSIYASAFDKDKQRLAVAVAEKGKSTIYVGAADGSSMTKVSKTELATHPAFSPEGQLAWVGGDENHGSQRVYVDGKAVSPAGFTASAPTFCDTEDGVFLIYAVSVGGGRQDLVLSRPSGQGLTRLTQGQGHNSYPACSPDGRLLAFFRETKDERGLYVLSLKRWTTKKVSSGYGQSLRWEPLPRDELTKATGEKSASPPIKTGPPSLGPACGLAPPPKAK